MAKKQKDTLGKVHLGKVLSHMKKRPYANSKTPGYFTDLDKNNVLASLLKPPSKKKTKKEN